MVRNLTVALLIVFLCSVANAQQGHVDMTIRNLTVTNSCKYENTAPATCGNGGAGINAIDLAYSFSQIPLAPANYKHQIVVNQNITIPANFVSDGIANDSVMTCTAAATEDTTFIINYFTPLPPLVHALGTVTVAAGQNQGVFSTSVAVGLVPNDILLVATPAVQDATLDGCAITIGVHR